jgi:hypothetical protein
MHLIKIISILFTMMSGICITFAQEQILISISPLIGDTLDRVEEDYFKLLSSIQGFQKAVFYMNYDSTFQINVTYTDGKILKDTSIQRNYSVELLRQQINQKLSIEINTTDEIERGEYLKCISVDGTESSGELLSVRKNSFLVFNIGEGNYFNNKNSVFSVSDLLFDEANKVISIDKTNIAKYIYPIVSGLLAYFIFEKNVKEDPSSLDELSEAVYSNAIYGGLVIGLGCLVGYGLGLLLPIWVDSKTEYDSPFNADDIAGLKKMARYQNGEPVYIQFVK